MPILAIDTSTIRASVAVLALGEVVFSETFVADRTHSVELFAILERALKVAPCCERIVIGLGPGSYSGIRIAISAAIGMGLGLKSELLGISSLVALETGAAEYLAIGDARREMFYYAHVSDRRCVEGPMVFTSEDLLERIAAHPSLPVFTSALLELVPSALIAFPAAEILAHLVAENRSIYATGMLEPIYLRPPHITTPRSGAPTR